MCLTCFCDWLQEAEYKRKLKAKRKQRDGLEADLGAGRGAARGGMRGRARSGHMDSPGDSLSMPACLLLIAVRQSQVGYVL